MQYARRNSLQNYEIDGTDGALQAQIEMPRSLWTAKGAPLSDALASAGFGDTPILTLSGKSYQIHRDWLNEKALISYYSVYLQDDAGHKIIEAKTPVEKRGSLICYKGSKFLVAPRSWFAFNYEVTNQNICIARFKDVSPFLTFSARRRYSIETTTPETEPILLSFAFFLAVSSAY
jgi:hypothetical protein